MSSTTRRENRAHFRNRQQVESRLCHRAGVSPRRRKASADLSGRASPDRRWKNSAPSWARRAFSNATSTKDDDLARLTKPSPKAGWTPWCTASRSRIARISDRPLVETSRAGYLLAQEVSAYSMIAVARATAPLMTAGGAMMTLTYLGSSRVVPNYNVMGMAKASLEAAVRYLAADLGPSGIRVNAISAGPVKTASARGIKDFSKILRQFPRTPRCAATRIRPKSPTRPFSWRAIWAAASRAMCCSSTPDITSWGFRRFHQRRDNLDNSRASIRPAPGADIFRRPDIRRDGRCNIRRSSPAIRSIASLRGVSLAPPRADTRRRELAVIDRDQLVSRRDARFLRRPTLDATS